MKKLIVYDLDGTLAESKSSLDAEMSGLLHDLLGIVKVAVISGGDWPQFQKQLLSNLPHDERLVNLSLLPTCGTKFFQYTGDWKKLYSEDFTADQKEKIVSSLKKALGVAAVSYTHLDVYKRQIYSFPISVRPRRSSSTRTSQ